MVAESPRARQLNGTAPARQGEALFQMFERRRPGQERGRQRKASVSDAAIGPVKLWIRFFVHIACKEAPEIRGRREQARH